MTNLEQENKCLQMQLDRALKDYDELEEIIDKLKKEYAFLSEKYDLLYNLKKQEVEENIYAKQIKVKSKETLLQERIKKALKYINNKWWCADNFNQICELRKILKGDSNE